MDPGEGDSARESIAFRVENLIGFEEGTEVRDCKKGGLQERRIFLTKSRKATTTSSRGKKKEKSKGNE